MIYLIRNRFNDWRSYVHQPFIVELEKPLESVALVVTLRSCILFSKKKKWFKKHWCTIVKGDQINRGLQLYQMMRAINLFYKKDSLDLKNSFAPIWIKRNLHENVHRLAYTYDGVSQRRFPISNRSVHSVRHLQVKIKVNRQTLSENAGYYQEIISRYQL